MLACGLLIVAGVVVILVGHSLPVFTVPFEQASAADMARCSDSARLDDTAHAHYFAMFGWHYALQNAGVSLAAAGVTASLLALALRRTAAPGMPWLRTPAHRWTFLVIGIGIIAGTFTGISHGLWTDFQRHYFPWCADSMGIPMSGLFESAIFITPILALAGGAITLLFGILPAPLSQWDATRPIRSWSVTLIIGAAMLGGTAIQLQSILSSDLTSPMAVITLYLLAATRAALLAPRR